MAIGTGGTSSANQNGVGSTVALTALRHPGSFIRSDGTVISFAETDADVATIHNALRDDQNLNQPAPAGGPMWGYSRNGQLYVPNRGWLKVMPGDIIMVDTATGWPILVSARSAASGPWTFTTT
jgi:hypothetical protein